MEILLVIPLILFLAGLNIFTANSFFKTRSSYMAPTKYSDYYENFSTEPGLVVKKKRNPYLPLHCKTSEDMTSNELRDTVNQIISDLEDESWVEKNS